MGIGLGDVLARFNTPVSVAVTGPGDVEASAVGPVIGGRDFTGYVAPRRELDAILAKAAADAGATVRTGVKFETIEMDGDTALVGLVDPASGRSKEQFDLVVGADGAYSAVRRAIGIDRPAMEHTHIAMRSYATITHPEKPVGDTLRLDFIDALLPAYGWVFPLPDNRANIGVGLPVSTLKKKGLKLPALLDTYVADLARRGYVVTDQERVASHQLPHAAAKQPMTTDAFSAVLLGDAASMINPFSGEGIFYGMAAGVQLAEHLRDAASAAGPGALRGRPLAQTLRQFEKSLRRRFQRHYRNCYTAHTFMRSRSWARIAVRAAARDEATMTLGALMMFDEESISPARFLSTAVRGLS